MTKGAIEYTNGTKPASASPAARPTMFCSATPAFTKRVGKRSANGSSAMNPRSPVRRTTRGVAPREVHEGAHERGPHADSTSASARRYSSSDIGR